MLDVIIRNAKRLKQLTDNILDVTKIESHSFKLNKERFDIVQLIEETAKEQNITISDTIITNAEIKIKILLKVNNKMIEDIAESVQLQPSRQLLMLNPPLSLPLEEVIIRYQPIRMPTTELIAMPMLFSNHF